MSNVFNRHDVVPFVAGETKPLVGQRLAKIGYKGRGNNAAKFKSVAVSVPFLERDDIENNLRALLPYIGNMLESAQDGIIRSRYEANNGELDVVSDADISVGACIAYLAAESEGDRLTKATLESWFDTEVAETVFVMIAEKLGFTATDPTPAQCVRINQSVTAYKAIISSLAGGKTMLQQPQITSLNKVLEAVNADDISRKLSARLTAMEKKLADTAQFADLL